MLNLEPLVLCLCNGSREPILTTKEKCTGPPCNGMVLGDVVVAVTKELAEGTHTAPFALALKPRQHTPKSKKSKSKKKPAE